MEIIQSPTVPRLQQNLWLDSTNNTLNAPTKDGWKSITSSGGAGSGMTKVTHDELVSLRDEGKLTPGALYRITDYVATTTQAGTKSANHPFDIVVVALDEKTLSEDAGAIAHSEEDLVKYKSVTWTDASGTHTAPFLMEANITMQGNKFLCAIFQVDEDHWTIYNPQIPGAIIIDVMTSDFEKTEDGYVIIGQPELEFAENYTIESGYFANSNLPAWELKYCLDNDTNWYAWAQKEIPAAEGVPFSLMTNHQFNWDTSGSRTEYGTAIFTRYQEGDPAFAPGYYAWGVVAHSRDCGFTAPGLDYTNIDTRFGFYYTESEHPTLSDTFYYKVWGEDRLNPLDVKLFEYTSEGQPGGKGVIYCMKDEHDNEAPFDFKGILLLLPQEWFENNSDWVADNLFNMSPDDLWLYVFTYFDFRGLSEPPTDFQDFVVDGSVVVPDDSCGYNKIMPYHNYEGDIITTLIPTNIFFGTYIIQEGKPSASHTKNNILNADCNHNIFGRECLDNIFDSGCEESKVWSNSSNNKVGSRAYELKLDGTANTIMNSCRTCEVRGTNNIIMNNCQVTFSAVEAVIFPDTSGEIDFGQYADYQYPKFAGIGGMGSSEIVQFTLDQISLNIE